MHLGRRPLLDLMQGARNVSAREASPRIGSEQKKHITIAFAQNDALTVDTPRSEHPSRTEQRDAAVCRAEAMPSIRVSGSRGRSRRGR